MALSLTLLALTLCLLVAGATDLARAAAEERALVARVVAEDEESSRRLLRWSGLDRRLLRTSAGRRLQETLDVAGISATPTRFALAGVGVSIGCGVLLSWLLSWLLFPVGCAVGVLAVRAYVSRQRLRRQDAFIAQMPELARVLSNGASAGLSIRTAVAMAAEELPEPARSELQEVSEQLNLGSPLDTAMSALERRLPSREVAILVGTVVISARSGGALVSALRDIAETLENRKELRREVRTTFAQAVATGYLVLALGIGVVFLLDAIQPGTVDTMLRHPLGQAALLVSGAIFGTGIAVIRRMTRIDV